MNGVFWQSIKANFWQYVSSVYQKKTAVGSLDPSDAVMCHQLAASYGRTNGGLLGNLGPAAPLLDPRSLVGAADFTPATKRGTTHSLQTQKLTVEKPWLFRFQHFNLSIWILSVFMLSVAYLSGGQLEPTNWHSSHPLLDPPLAASVSVAPRTTLPTYQKQTLPCLAEMAS